VARPDGIVTYRKGYHLEIGTDRELSAAHLDLMQISMGMIQSLSGVTDESMGRTTNATSGKAIVARQEQGQLATAFLFDNLRMARLFHGEKKLSLIEQFFSDYRTFRVTNERGVPTWIEINKAEDPESDIVRSKADFILSESSWSASVRQAEVQGLTDIIIQMAPVAPQLALLLLDLLIEAMDIPNREEIVNRVRSITGAEDPEADPENPTPEMQARAQAKAAEAQMAQRAAEANVAKIEGEAALKLSQADKARRATRKNVFSERMGDKGLLSIWDGSALRGQGEYGQHEDKALWTQQICACSSAACAAQHGADGGQQEGKSDARDICRP
jgi:hypothetical protein